MASVIVALRAFCIILAAIVLAAGYSLTHNLIFGAAAEFAEQQSWPTTQGIVLESAPTWHWLSRTSMAGNRKIVTTSKVHTARVRYEYTVNGQRITGERVGVEPGNSVREAEAFVAKYPKGSAVTVHYNPSEPTDAVLIVTDRTPRHNKVFAAVAALSTLLVAAALIWLGIKKAEPPVS